MISKKSKRLIIELINKEMKRLAFDANVFASYIRDNPIGRKNAERRKELQIVLNELEDNP